MQATEGSVTIATTTTATAEGATAAGKLVVESAECGVENKEIITVPTVAMVCASLQPVSKPAAKFAPADAFAPTFAAAAPAMGFSTSSSYTKAAAGQAGLVGL